MLRKYRSGCSQLSIGRSTGSPKKELEKVPKELKGFAAPEEEHQYEVTSTPRAPWNYTTNQRKHMMQLVAIAIYVAEDDLIAHQWEERPLVL